MAYLVIRKPVLPEDEGHYTVVRSFNTEEEAKEWICAQQKEYFGPGDYYYTEGDTTGGLLRS